MLSDKQQGFAAFSPEKHKEASSRGGRKSGAKGFARLSPEERKRNASEASRARWSRRKVKRTAAQQL